MNYNDLLDLKLEQEIKDLDLNPMIGAIENMASKVYWESKNKRLGNLLTSDVIARILVKTTIGFSIQIQELVGILCNKISKGLEYKEALKNAVDVIEAANGFVYDIQYGDPILINSKFQLEPSTYEYIALRKYEPPMLQEPSTWTNNHNGGYYENDLHCILGSSHNQHNKQQALDVLNKLQSIPLELDSYMVQFDEEPNKEFKSPDSHEQFKTMATNSKKTYQQYTDRPFWFIWQFDKRGRQYSRGYHINIQASGFKKSLISLFNKELIT